MQTIHALDALRSALNLWKKSGERVALVPTMGALHAGHLALVHEARRRATRVVVSIFVNPTQFAPNEDLARYPRQLAADEALLAEAGCDIVWAPEVATMYPSGFATEIAVAGVSEPLEGAARPGHFAGVATVVAKLLNQVRPDVALFGEKDFQQLAVIRRMVLDLDFGIEIAGVPTVRDADGLALSSRNAYLDPADRVAATALPWALRAAADKIAAGVDPERALADARADIEAAGFSIDYVSLADAATLLPVDSAERPARLLAAARLGGVRLIDNIPVFAEVTGSSPR